MQTAKYHQVGRWLASLNPARIYFSRPYRQNRCALFYEEGLSMTVRYVAIIAPTVCGKKPLPLPFNETERNGPFNETERAVLHPFEVRAYLQSVLNPF